VIYDHVSGTLSALDRQVIDSVPAGGNWRNLPAGFDSQRIKQIRRSVANGEGSRSTYYGRLRWDRPAYTISTYFSRPGNGCFIHPAAPRLISVREAARLQSFPDVYRFSGNGRKRFLQVGNAVPPLLAFQIARALPPGPAIDLFAGAGGLSLGFSWAGHHILAAVDNDPAAIETLRRNGHDSTEVLKADLSDPTSHATTMRHLVRIAGETGIQTLMGGPPCQGFSTAGHCRLDDPRNKLVFSFVTAAEVLRPNFVLMENVPAILWRGRRAILDEICSNLSQLGYQTSIIVAHAEGYGVPQLRRRLFLLGALAGTIRWPLPWRRILEPSQLRYQPAEHLSDELSAPLTVADAIGDLPCETYSDGDVGSDYHAAPATPYQHWVRGDLPLKEFVPMERFTHHFPTSLFELAGSR
jgi:DNA (cytosine-5)-methyltransferase 1